MAQKIFVKTKDTRANVGFVHEDIRCSVHNTFVFFFGCISKARVEAFNLKELKREHVDEQEADFSQVDGGKWLL